MRELIKIIVTKDHGAGFSTCNKEFPDIEKDSDIISELENGNVEGAIAVCEKKYPGSYADGLRKSRIETMPKGTLYRITTYDGLETVKFKSNEENWKTA